MIKKISIKAVIIGGLLDIIGTNIWSIILLIYLLITNIITPSILLTQPLSIININNHPVIFIINIIVATSFSVIGGYVAAFIAKRRELIHGILSSFLCVFFGVYGIVKGIGSSSLAIQLILLVVSPLLGLFGGYLKLLKSRNDI